QSQIILNLGAKMKKYLALTLGFIITLILVGCTETPYQKLTWSSYTGGYYETAAPGGLTQVNFSGNEFLPDPVIKEYVVFRCAQLGKEKGKLYFAMYNSITDAINNHKTTLPDNILKESNKPTSYVYVEYHNEKKLGDLSVNETFYRFKSKFLGK